MATDMSEPTAGWRGSRSDSLGPTGPGVGRRERGVSHLSFRTGPWAACGQPSTVPSRLPRTGHLQLPQQWGLALELASWPKSSTPGEVHVPSRTDAPRTSNLDYAVGSKHIPILKSRVA